MPIPFSYPQNGWSTGKMRKRGQKPYAPDFEHAFGATAGLAGGEMTPAQQVFERSRPELGEGASGKAMPAPTDKSMGGMLLKGPAGQVLGGVSLGMELGKQFDKLPFADSLRAWIKGDLSKKKLGEMLDKHGWSIADASEGGT